MVATDLNNMDSDLHIFNNLFTEYQGRFVRFASTYVADRMGVLLGEPKKVGCRYCPFCLYSDIG